MKRRTLLLALALFILAAAPERASAQALVKVQTPLVNQYIDDANVVRGETWWNALDRQLVLALDTPVTETDETALQNIIFFASTQGDKLNLDGATPRLVDIYKHHPEQQFRLMAIVALNALNADRELRQIYRQGEKNDPERLRDITLAALSQGR